MENNITINGKKIKLTAEQVKEIAQILVVSNCKLSDFAVGDTCTIGNYEFIVLEQSGDTTALILKEFLEDSAKFGANNNYVKSNVDSICNKFADEIAKIVGEENLVEHTVDLTADDGLKCYGSVKRKMSLLTAALYRKYVYVLDSYNQKKWWWLATAYSTDKHNDHTWIKCVSPSGYVYDDYYYNYFGVRPFCILKSNIFVSK